ncbi:MAG: CPBP family intramembrane metalloprotease [Thermosipho sp. (in: Bacteria)]|nr:CPBP family intramembrane metalloprotease [Thermosipho sp. (in: thermotogales)]
MTMNKNTRKALLFIGLTFFFNYLLVILYFALGGKWTMPGSLILAVTYMFIPMITAIMVQKIIYKKSVKEPLGISFKLNRWFLVAWLLPPVIAFATLGVSLLFPGVEYSPEMAGMFERLKSVLTPEQLKEMEKQTVAFPVHPIWIGLLQGLIAGITINAVAGFGEELGWRGLLQKELSYLGFWKSSAVIGVIWGLWHAPIILQGHNYPEHPLIGVFMMTIFTLLLSPIFSYVRLKAKSVIAAAIMHGSINGTLGLSIMVIKGGSDLTVGVTGLAGFIVLALVNIGLFLYDRTLAKESIMQNYIT